MKQVIDKATNYVSNNGNDLQKKVLQFILNNESKNEIVNSFKKYQNNDGGWGNGLEIEYQGDISTPMTTANALGYIYLFNLEDTELLKNTINYLKNTQINDGSWDDKEEITNFEIPPYMGPKKYLDYKTGMIIKWLKRLNVNEIEMIDKAKSFMINNFDDISKNNDMWSAIAYAGSFSEFPEENETPRIMEWAINVLQSSNGGQSSNGELQWLQIQGMIIDDDKMLTTMKDNVINSIKQNQLEHGGWPHPFGSYNAVWAAILIVRYLKKINY